MAYNQNKLMAKAIRNGYQEKSILLPLGVTDPKQSLTGVKAKQVEITNWDAPTENVEDFGIVDSLTPEVLGQTSFIMDINHYGKAYRVKDEMLNWAVDGKDAPTIAKDYLTTTISRFVDKGMLDEVYTSTINENTEGTDVINGDLIYTALFDHFKEGAEQKAKAFVIHTRQLKYLKNDPDFVSQGFTKVHPNQKGVLFGFLPVIASDLVGTYQIDTNADGVNDTTIYKNAIVKTNSLAYILGEEVKVEQERDTLAKATDYSVDTYFGLKAVDESIIIESK